MPPKQPSKERTWGTRYDTLDSSPPHSPPNKHFPPPITIPHNPVASVALVFDPDAADNDPNTRSPTMPKVDKMPHDSSIFVGSLPTTIEHAELTRLLQEYLSEHAEVKNVKVIRDTRGGVCAFVQCEDSFAAARLLRTLHSLPPRPFLGRTLRYELARAFRTLLISYRSPTHFALSADSDDGLNANGGKLVALEPATAMRIHRHRSAKALVILYNDEARDFEGETASTHSTECSDALEGVGILYSPLKYDAESLHKLAGAFGPVEHFVQYKPDGNSIADEKDKAHPPPHDAIRAEGMDPDVYEVKWRHRDDCVSALMTLRRVPHLTVSWAHHSPSFNAITDARSVSASNFATNLPPYISPARMQPRIHMGTGADYQRPRDPRAPGIQGYTTSMYSRQPVAPSMSPSGMSSPPDTAFAHSTPFLYTPSSPSIAWSPAYPAKSPRWTACDFPSIDAQNADDEGSLVTHKPSPRWGDCIVDEEESAAGQCSDQPQSPSSCFNTSTSLVESVAGLAIADDSKRSPGSPVQSRQNQSAPLEPEAMPPTVDVSISPITPLTPRTSHGHSFPQTPTSAVSSTAFGDSQSFYDETGFKGIATPQTVARSRDGGFDESARELDPMTIFVGGLEMFGAHVWDELQLRNVFGKFGQIEDIQFVRPFNKRTAFAFVRYNNPEAPARAVFEEHNRIHHGRHIRVQLRDNNPPQRGMWRYNRGRGRFHHGGIPRFHEMAAEREGRKIGSAERSMVGPAFSSSMMGQGGIVSMHSGSQMSHASDTGFSSSPSVTNTSTPQFDHPSNATVTSTTPPPSSSSIGPSSSMTGLTQQYTMPSFGYYGPQPWIQAYPQYAYSVPLVPGYGGYQMPPPQTSQAFTGAETTSAGPGAHHTWGASPHTCKPMVPYVSYPFVANNNEQVQTQANQPPLRPTGFIQGNQGTLIPVYHPQALDQYMSHAQHTHAPPPHTPGYNQAIASWPGYQPLPVYPYPVPAPPLAPATAHDTHAAQRGWGSSPVPLPVGYPVPRHGQSNSAPPYLLPTLSSGPFTTPSSLHGPHSASHMHRQNHNTPPPRRFNRREHYLRGESEHIHPSRGSPGRPKLDSHSSDHSYNITDQNV